MFGLDKKKTIFLLALLCLSVGICVAQNDDFIDVFDDDEVEIVTSVRLEESKSSSLKKETKPEIKKNASETEKIMKPPIFSCPGVVPNEAYFRNRENMRKMQEEMKKNQENASETIDVKKSDFNKNATESKYMEELDYGVDEGELEFED